MKQIQHGPKLESIERTRRIASVAKFGIEKATGWVKQRAGLIDDRGQRIQQAK